MAEPTDSEDNRQSEPIVDDGIVLAAHRFSNQAFELAKEVRLRKRIPKT